MPSDDCLKKLYIEPTARCNLRCKMCFRNSWKNEIIGDMRMETFRKAMTTMPDSVETVFFGGMGGGHAGAGTCRRAVASSGQPWPQARRAAGGAP